MHSIRLDVSDKIFDNVMMFLNQLPKSDLKIKVAPSKQDTQKAKSLVEFFQSSPLVDQISVERSSETYSDRVRF
jgi:hypothetical protein